MKPLKIILALNLLLILFSCSKDDITEPIIPPVVVAPKVPKTTTNEVTDNSVYSIKISGKLIESGDTPVTELGFVLDTNTMPTIEHNSAKGISHVDAEGNFAVIYETLPSNTLLHIRSYAINSDGVGYGNEVTCTTLTQNVFTGNSVTLNNQQEVDAFGANHYNIVNGDIYIQGNTITNLSPLADLVIAYGDLYIQNTHLLDFSGLENLKLVGGILRISDNGLLLNCNGLNNLEKVTSEFYLINNNSLINCEGLDNLKLISGDLRIDSNDNIETLSSFSNLLGIGHTLFIGYNPKLTSINTLSNLKIINYSIYINTNPLLQNLNGLENIKKLNRLEIINNESLTNLNGLNNLESIEWVINIKNNNNLITLNGLEKVVSITDPGESSSYLVIINNSSLINLNGLENLNIMGADKVVTITDNNNLSGFCPLKKLFTNNQNFSNLTITNNLTNPSINNILSNCL